MSANEKNIMIEPQASITATRFVRSKMFSNVFAEGMELVEDTAAYLDGTGRDLSRELDRPAALSYAGISMRLTTRLMQIASWLLVMRAVREEEMTYAEAAQDKYRLGTPEQKHENEPDEESANLPERLIELREETDRLYTRIARMDADIFRCHAEGAGGDATSQLRALHDAFPG